MIEGIKGVNAQLELMVLRNWKEFGDRRIQLLLPIGMERIDVRIPISHRRSFYDEGARIEPVRNGWVAQLSAPDTIGAICLPIVEGGRVIVGNIEANSAPNVQQR